MERRALIAVVISLVILIVYQEVIIKHLYGPPTGPLPGEAPPSMPPPPPAAPAPEPPRVPAEPVAERAEGRDITVETDRYRAVFTTAGARLKSLGLKDYRTTITQGSPPLQMVLHTSTNELPLGVELRGEQSVSDAAVDYQVDRERLSVAAEDTGTLTFTGKLDGATIRKRIEFRGDQYLWGLDVDVSSVPPEYTELAIAWDEGHDGIDPVGGEVVFESITALQGTKLRTESFGSLEKGKLLSGDIIWAGFSGRYFLAAFVPSTEAAGATRLWMSRNEHTVQARLLMPAGLFSTHMEVYVGPKERDKLEAAGHSLDRSIDLGWFTFVALPMLMVLQFLHRFSSNYGVDIILLTVLIKILFYPLTQKSLKSMREMQKLQPEMAKLRERLKDKPEEMNKAIMGLYKQNKVNPLGGCLPMLLQMPVFIGLYQALLNAVELRHGPFVWWVNDLSAPDRLGSIHLPFVEPPGIPVLTLLMGASMLLQQWMTPTAGDPTQQRIMMLMPLLFTFMFINFPAGLTLYWLINNILTIAQQYYMIRKRP